MFTFVIDADSAIVMRTATTTTTTMTTTAETKTVVFVNQIKLATGCGCCLIAEFRCEICLHVVEYSQVDLSNACDTVCFSSSPRLISALF